jgi:hypothetical protein
MIGSQDGLFQERGEHIPYEMWGIWAPPVKVLNGFWLKVDEQLVQNAVSYEQLPYGAIFSFQREGDWKMDRFQFVPQEEKGLILEVSIANTSEEDREYELSLGMQSNLMPVWLAERAGITDGQDEGIFDAASGRLVFTDSNNPWTAAVSCTMETYYKDNAEVPVSRRENPNTCYCEMACKVALQAGEKKTVTYYLAFSEHSGQETEDTLRKLEQNKEALLQEKVEYYEQIDRTAVLNLPNKPLFEEMYRWTKYINDWIIRDVDKMGCGVVAGYAEFPWWFGNDTNYIVPALLMQGEYEACKSTLRLVKKKSLECNGNGRVVHEISSNGEVYYEGMTTETPQFADTVWMVYQWSGDHAFLEEMYDFCVMGMDWIESMCVDGLPVGYGISEIAGLDCFCCDTTLLTIRGFEILALMSAELGKNKLAEEYQRKQKETWELFQKEFYLPQYGVYGDMVATKEDILPRAETWKYTLCSFPITEEEKIMGESSCKKDKSPEDAEEKARLRKRMEGVAQEAMKMEDGSRKAFYLFGFGHSTIPVEFGYLDKEQAEAIFDAQAALNQKEKITIENMMPIGIGREIIGLANIKRLDEVLADIQKVADGFSKVMPGATNEIYPEQGCFVQAWNSLATMWPYANSMFGIRPNAYQKKLVLNPCVGQEIDGMSLKNLRIGGESFNMSYRRDGEWDVILVERPSEDWTIELAEGAENIRLVVK